VTYNRSYYTLFDILGHTVVVKSMILTVIPKVKIHITK